MPRFGGVLAGWRGLGRFWAALSILLAAAAGTLQLLGPAPNQLAATAPQAWSPPGGQGGGPKLIEHRAAEAKPPATRLSASRARRPGRDIPGPIADPDPAMLESYASAPTQKLPRIARDGRMPMSVYAAGFDPETALPRVGVLIAGIGIGEAVSLSAMQTLPAAVTLAFSPYANEVEPLLEIARSTGHEYLLAIPMEPDGYPVNDPDDHYALMSALPPAENLNRLHGFLARITGYVGVTNALGRMHGERFSAVQDQLDAVLEDVAHRGLLFVDARTGQRVQGLVWNRPADILIDGPPVNAAAVDVRLAALAQLALEKGSALGVVSVPRPVTIERLVAWTAKLADDGLALAPVSALVLPPATQDPEK